MLFIAALIIAIIFVAVFNGLLKKNPDIFYVTAAVVSIAAYILSSYVPMYGWVKDYVVGIFARGSLGTAFFVLVMYAGAMKNVWKPTKTLMKIRGELSIMGCVLVLCHNCTYGRIYFRRLFLSGNNLLITQKLAAIISIILIVIMLILTITSFPQIRRKINAVKWKKLQRTAYIFYGLIYVHILLINIPYARRGMYDYVINVVVYSLVFVIYAVMRIYKAVSKKLKQTVSNGEKSNIYITSLRAGLTIAGVIVIAGTVFMCFAGIDNDDYIESDKVYAQMTDNDQNNASQTGQNATEESSKTVKEENSEAEESGEAVTKQSADNENNNQGINTDTADDKEKISDSEDDVSSKAANNTNDSIINNDGNSSVNTSSDSSSENNNSISSTTDNNKEDTNVIPTEAARKFKADGTYTATVKCQRYNYMITVQVVIASDAIAQVNATSATKDADDLMYFNMAAEVIPSKLISAQGSQGVDTVSGATYSSKAIISAFNSAVN